MVAMPPANENVLIKNTKHTSSRIGCPGKNKNDVTAIDTQLKNRTHRASTR